MTWSSIPTAARACCARRSARCMASIPARIVAGGEGSGPLLTMLANAYLQPGDEAIFSRHAFLVYEIATRANSATPVMVPEKDTNRGIKIDVDAMLAAVTPKTRMVYIANPNNPTGTYLNREEMARLHAGLPDECAAGDRRGLCRICRPPRITKPGIELVRAHDNVVMTRTFSKLYGLAGLRLGWVYAPAGGVRCAQPHPRPVQHLDRCSSRWARPRCATASISGKPVKHNNTVAALDHGGNPQDRPAGRRQRRQFRADPFPGRRRKDRGQGRCLSQPAAASSCGPSAAMACPIACA